MANKAKKLINRFNKKIIVSDSGCWDWIGAVDAKGYGRFFLGGETKRAHRASYIMHRGIIPDGQIVMHRCDNPGCVNPEHLFVGTYSDNANDMHSKGRGNNPRGERHFNSRLKCSQIPTIRTMSSRGDTAKSIADKFKVSSGAIRNVLKGRTWKHV